MNLLVGLAFAVVVTVGFLGSSLLFCRRLLFWLLLLGLGCLFGILARVASTLVSSLLLSTTRLIFCAPVYTALGTYLPYMPQDMNSVWTEFLKTQYT